MDEEKERAIREKSRMRVILEESIPYLICLLCSFSGAGYFLVSKVSLNKGMSRYVLVTYGFAIGTLSTALLAYLFERKNNSKLTIPVLRNVFFLGLLGAVLGRTMFYLGLEYTSQTFASAVSNIFPVFTFILAIIFRMEKLDISKNSTRAKIGGTVVSFAGATILTLYKGIKVISVHTQSSHNQSASTSTQLSFEKAHWIKGSLILVSSYFSIAAFYLLQAATVKIYAAPLNLTTLSCLSGTLFSVIMTAILDHKAASWRLSWDITLLAPLYSGIIIFSLGIYLQTIVMRRKGPVFAIAFSPLSSIFAAIMGILILGDVLYLGSIIGATLIIIGLYSILWGKKKEEDIILERTMATDHLNKIKAEGAKSNIDIPNNGINWS